MDFFVGNNGFMFLGMDNGREVFGVVIRIFCFYIWSGKEEKRYKFVGSSFFMGWYFFEE